MLTPVSPGYAADHCDTSGATNVLPAPTSWPAERLLWLAVAVAARLPASDAHARKVTAARLETLNLIPISPFPGRCSMPVSATSVPLPAPHVGIAAVTLW